MFHHPAILPSCHALRLCPFARSKFRTPHVAKLEFLEESVLKHGGSSWEHMGGHGRSWEVMCVFSLIHPSSESSIMLRKTSSFFFHCSTHFPWCDDLHMTFHVVFPCPDQHRTWTCRALPAPAKMQMSTFHQAGHGSKLGASKFQRDIHRIGCFMMANRLDWQYQLILLNKNRTPK